MEGRVMFFNRIKGFGFINGDDGRDYFVHFSAVKEGKYLNEGDRVRFEGIEDEKGLKAKDVEIIGKEEAKEETEEEAPAETPAEEATEEAASEPVEEEAPENKEENKEEQ